jgi:hypothetical protein
LFRLSSFICFDPVNTAAWLVSLYLIIPSIICQSTAYTSIHNNLDSLCLKLLYSLSKAANLFETSIQYCSLASNAFHFSRLNLSISNLCILFIHCQSPLNFWHQHQIVVTTCCLNARTSTLECCHQNMVNRIVGFLNQNTSKFVHFWDVAKFTTLTPLPLLILCKLHFQLSVWKYLVWNTRSNFS